MESEDNDRTGSTREKTEPEEYLVGDENPPHPLGLEEELHEVLPPFANEENRLLDAEVKERSKKLEQVDNQLGDQRERISIMKDHLRNVEQEMLHTQALCQAKENEIETEDHLKRLAERELERTDADKRKIEKEIGDIQNKISSRGRHESEKSEHSSEENDGACSESALCFRKRGDCDRINHSFAPALPCDL
eukprot:175545_1